MSFLHSTSCLVIYLVCQCYTMRCPAVTYRLFLPRLGIFKIDEFHVLLHLLYLVTNEIDEYQLLQWGKHIGIGGYTLQKQLEW